MIEEVSKRVESLSAAVTRLAGRSRMVVETDNPALPVYLTTHFDKPFAGVQIATQCKDTEVQPHAHDASEWFFVLEGLLQITTDSDTYTLGPGEHLALESKVAHRTLALEDTQYVIITMPNIVDELSSLFK